MSEAGSALRSVLSWSRKRPAWQRDALRRLYEGGSLSAEDEEELYAIARSMRRVGDTDSGVEKTRPLVDANLPAPSSPGTTVALEAIRDVQHVNALAPDQNLAFGESGLTAIYGDNAAGKSGYGRILRQVCRSRGGDHRVLPNVFNTRDSGIPTATIAYRVGGREAAFEWSDGKEVPDALTQMSFFDSQSASAIVASQNELAYAPVAVDLLHQLAQTCKRLKDRAVRERDALSQHRSPTTSDPPIRKSGAVDKALSSLRWTTRIESIRELATLDETEEKREGELGELLRDNPGPLAKMARLDRERLERLCALGERLRIELGEDRIEEHRGLVREATQARTAARESATGTFQDEPLRGVGTDTWRRLWEAARQYSTREAYPASEFPRTEEGARCVLCHQELGEAARARMVRFERFVQTRLESAAQKAEHSMQQSELRLKNLNPNRAEVRQLIQNVKLTDEELAEALKRFFALARWRLRQLLRLSREGEGAEWGDLVELPAFPSNKTTSQIERLTRRENELRAAAHSDERQRLQRELADLTDRRWLAKQLPAVQAEIERLKQLERMGHLIRDLDSSSVTRKSTEITEQIVTKQLANAFNAELVRLSVRTAKVRLGRATGRYGAPRFQIELDGLASGQVKAAEVLSEGEHRAIALAGFLAELESTGDRSALIFDDPVSSLDHKWRRAVARRLVEEAERRQVIVFTHDPVFLLMLQDSADDRDTEVKHWRLVRRDSSTGVPLEEPPNLKVKSRLADLNRRIQDAAALKRREGDAAYEPAARDIYYRLRKAWERAVEEVLLAGVIERLGDEIHTQKLRDISDITDGEVETVERSMSKCSRFAHDQATPINEPVPEPDEVQADIIFLKEWCKAIRDRRN